MRILTIAIALCMLQGCAASTLVYGYGAIMRQANLMGPAPQPQNISVHCTTSDFGMYYTHTNCQ